MKNFLALPLLLIITGCGGIQQTPGSYDYLDQDIPIISYDETSFSETFVKPDNWITVENTEIGFSVDVPPTWPIVIEDYEFSGLGDGILLNNGRVNGPDLIFYIPREGQDGNDVKGALVERQDNADLIAVGGEAFRYFSAAYGDVRSGHPFIRPIEERAQAEKGSPIISFGIATRDFNDNTQNSVVDQQYFQDLEEIKLIIRSFKRVEK